MVVLCVRPVPLEHCTSRMTNRTCLSRYISSLFSNLCRGVTARCQANGSSFTGARLICESAKNGDFPPYLAKIRSQDNPAPARACIFQSAIAMAMLAAGNFDSLLAYFSVAAWLFYFLAVSCLLVLRWSRPAAHRPFQVWLVVPVAFCCIAVALVIAIVSQQPVESALAVLGILSALPVYACRQCLRTRGYLVSAPLQGYTRVSLTDVIPAHGNDTDETSL
eukprot:m.531892 g.531892  ORF g.531892 m.531892 type:complete len:221 (-) comp22041_c1_seq9:1040-1702(-)